MKTSKDKAESRPKKTSETGNNVKSRKPTTSKAAPSVEDIRTDDLLGDYPAVRYYPLDGELFFDILTRLGEAAGYETVESEVKEIEGIHVRIATPQALYQLKKGTVRPIDRQDAAALRERFNLKDE